MFPWRRPESASPDVADFLSSLAQKGDVIGVAETTQRQPMKLMMMGGATRKEEETDESTN